MSKEIEINGGELFGPPNDNYKKFFAKFNEINSLPVKEFKTVHLIGYFCKKYKEHYNTNYKFKFNSSAPSKCFEVFQIKKLASYMSSDPSILIKYIDWIFQNKVTQAKRKLTSISFMTHEDVVNEYKIKYLFNTKVDRSTEIPQDYKLILESFGFNSINTYGDLAFMIQSQDSSFDITLIALENKGFDKSTLDSIV